MILTLDVRPLLRAVMRDYQGADRAAAETAVQELLWGDIRAAQTATRRMGDGPLRTAIRVLCAAAENPAAGHVKRLLHAVVLLEALRDGRTGAAP